MNLRTVNGRAIMHELSGLPSEAHVKIEIATDADEREYVHSVREYIPKIVSPREVRDGFWIVSGQWLKWPLKWISEIRTCQGEHFRKKED